MADKSADWGKPSQKMPSTNEVVDQYIANLMLSGVDGRLAISLGSALATVIKGKKGVANVRV